MPCTRRLLPVFLPLVCAALAGCAVLSLMAVPFRLLFQVFESIGSGLGSLAGSVAFIDVHEGVAPRLVPLGDGQFAVEGVLEGARFDVILTAPGHAAERYRWPEDLAGLVSPGRHPAGGGDVEVPCVLAPISETD